MDNFLNSIEKHLPTWAREENDWAVNLQAEGASAVHAAIDMCLQVYQPGADFNAPGAKTLVACGASSYHGPASTSPGGATPLGARAKGLTHPARYPVPSPFWRHRGEDDAGKHRDAPSLKNSLPAGQIARAPASFRRKPSFYRF